jgi:hypothetical protein
MYYIQRCSSDVWSWGKWVLACQDNLKYGFQCKEMRRSYVDRNALNDIRYCAEKIMSDHLDGVVVLFFSFSESIQRPNLLCNNLLIQHVNYKKWLTVEKLFPFWKVSPFGVKRLTLLKTAYFHYWYKVHRAMLMAISEGSNSAKHFKSLPLWQGSLWQREQSTVMLFLVTSDECRSKFCWGEAFWKTGNSIPTYFDLKLQQKNAYGGLMYFQPQLFASCSSLLATNHALFTFNCKQPQRVCFQSLIICRTDQTC